MPCPASSQRLPRLLLAGLLAWVVACGQDPILERAAEEAADEAGAGVSGGVVPGGDGAQPTLHQQAAPMPGPGTSPPQGTPGVPPENTAPGDTPDHAGNPDEAVPGTVDPLASDGATVTVTGSVRYDGYTSGMVRVDVFDGDQTDFSLRPSVVAVEQLTRPGPFSVRIPQSAGKVWFSAFNDENQNNRPDPRDPVGFYKRNPVELGAGDVQGIVIELEVRPPPTSIEGER